ncbi:SAV_915 family protein [Rhodococcus triatomae]
MLYVPVRTRRGTEPIQLELRRLADESMALLVYTSPHELTRCCGTHQAAATVAVDKLHEVQRQVGASVILVDGALPIEQQKNQSVDLHWEDEDSHLPDRWLESPLDKRGGSR